MGLREEDEFLHAPPEGAPPAWQENLFFICWDLGRDAGMLCHVQRVPARGLQEVLAVVCVDGVEASTSIVAPYGGELAPGLDAIALEPFRSWRFALDTRGSVGRGPLGFFATRCGGDTPMSASLALGSELAVADFAQGLATIVNDMRADAAGPQMGDQQHYEQGGVWRGHLQVGDHRVSAEGLFVRDHSWGVRHEHQDFRAFWTASCLDEGRRFCNAIGIPRGDEVLGVGAVSDASGTVFTADVTASFSPRPGVCTYDRTEVRFGAPVGQTLTAETRIHIPVYLPHSGPRRYDNNAISALRMGGATGFGVMEWASVLAPEDARALDAVAVS